MIGVHSDSNGTKLKVGNKVRVGGLLEQFMVTGFCGADVKIKNCQGMNLTRHPAHVTVVESEKSKPESAALEDIQAAIECALALDMKYQEGQNILKSHGYVDADRFDFPATKFVSKKLELALELIKVLNE